MSVCTSEGSMEVPNLRSLGITGAYSDLCVHFLNKYNKKRNRVISQNMYEKQLRKYRRIVYDEVLKNLFHKRPKQ